MTTSRSLLRHSQRRWLALAVLAPALLLSAPAQAAVPPIPLRVVLPAHAMHRYPVVFVLNAVFAECQPSCARVEASLRRLPAIVVFESRSTYLSDYVDWRDGSVHGEQQLLAAIRWVDARYPTSHDRRDRVIAGISAGGYGAMLLAAKHASLFGHAASFSGPLDLRGPNDGFEPTFDITASAPGTDPAAVFGTPIIDDTSWKRRSPADLVSGLRRTDVYHVASTGKPCRTTESPITVEPLVAASNDGFATAAAKAGVHDTYVRRPCGVHGYDEFIPEVDDWIGNHLKFRRAALS